MDIKQHTTPDNLLKYSFWWSEVRLVIAAIALFIGGTPPIFKIISYSLYGSVGSLLSLCWIISGVASAYLLYRWFTGGKTLFGGNEMKDNIAFFVSAISGINLGIAGLIRDNIGMNISSAYIVFLIVGVLYLLSAYHLYTRWSDTNGAMFGKSQTPSPQAPQSDTPKTEM